MPTDVRFTDTELVEYFHLGWNNQRIADKFGVTRQAVSKRLVDMGLYRHPIAREVQAGLAQRWTIHTTPGKDSHHNSYSAKRLTEWLRWRLGDELSEDQIKRAKAWERRLHRDGTVLCYDPDTEEGWYYRPRLKIDGRLVIDWPRSLPFPSEKFKKALELGPEPPE
jgi:hypothetical protein